MFNIYDNISIHLNYYKQLPVFNMTTEKDLNLTLWPPPLAGTTTMYLHDISDVIDVLTSTMEMFLFMMFTPFDVLQASLILQGDNTTVIDLFMHRLSTVSTKHWTTFELHYRRQSTHQSLLNNIFCMYSNDDGIELEMSSRQRTFGSRVWP